MSYLSQILNPMNVRSRNIRNFPRLSNRIFFLNLICLFLIITISAFHLFKLDNIPRGLFIDETSIGYNAALIAQTGKDEYGVNLPVYFKAFGEYKNPIYIYTAALIFKLVGVSEFNLRVTSFIFYLAALIAVFLLTIKIFKSNQIIPIYILLTVGFLPHFFTVSRISFEVISQVTAVSFTLLLVEQIFHSENNQKWWLSSLLGGLLLGISIYTYSTARLLSILMLISLWLIYLKRENIKKLVLITVSFVTALIPFTTFIINNPGALTARFHKISYIDDSIPIANKILFFLQNCLTYLSPDFLSKYGDSNLRHSTGYGGIIFPIVLFLFLIGLVAILSNKNVKNNFNLFVLVNLCFSPLPAVLTNEGTPHALRSLLMSLYIVIISAYGLDFLLKIKTYRIKNNLVTCIFIVLMFETIGYTFNYFVYYSPKSIEAMKTYNFKQSLQTAIDQSPREIIVSNVPPLTYANLKFYQLLVKNPQNIPIRLGKPVPELESCLVYYRWNEPLVNSFPHPFTELKNDRESTWVMRMLNVPSPKEITRVRCFYSPSTGSTN